MEMGDVIPHFGVHVPSPDPAAQPWASPAPATGTGEITDGRITVPFAFTAPLGLASNSAPRLLNVFASVYVDLSF